MGILQHWKGFQTRYISRYPIYSSQPKMQFATKVTFCSVPPFDNVFGTCWSFPIWHCLFSRLYWQSLLVLCGLFWYFLDIFQQFCLFLAQPKNARIFFPTCSQHLSLFAQFPSLANAAKVCRVNAMTMLLVNAMIIKVYRYLTTANAFMSWENALGRFEVGKMCTMCNVHTFLFTGST